MHGETDFLLDLVIILTTSLVGGFLAKKAKYPAVLGQILGGIIIGPSLLHLVEHNIFIENVAQIGVILLMFLAGLETNFKELKESIGKSTAIAIGGIVVPFLFGGLAILVMKDSASLSEMIFTGTVLTATSMGITIQTLGDLGILKSKVGTSVLGAAVLDDIIGVIILTVVLGVYGDGHTSIQFLILKIIAFFLLVVFIGKIITRFVAKNKTLIKKISSKILLIGSISLAFLFAVFANQFGVAAIIGAYIIGVILSMTNIKHKIEKDVQSFGSSFFIPVFFINIGLSVDMSGIGNCLGIAVVIMLAGILSKIIGSGIAAKLVGFDKDDAINIGVAMVPRAEVALIITSLGVKTGLIGVDVLAGIVLLVVVSTIITPLILKKRIKQKEQIS